VKTLHIRFPEGSRRIFDPAVLFAFAALLLAALPLTFAKPTPLRDQPFPDSHEYADAANQLAHGNGYVTYVHGSKAQPPRYPPGYSVALLPFVKWGPEYPKGAELGAKFFVLALLLAVWGTTWLLGGPIAAGFAAGLAVTSSFWTSMSHLILSDPLAATLVVLSLALVTRPKTKRVALAGALVGASVLVRLSNVVTLACLVAALPRKRPRLTALVAALPFVVALLVYQWATFGQPLATGYHHYYPDLREFAPHYAWAADPLRDGPNLTGDRLHGRLMSWACPCPANGPMAVLENAAFYPAIVLGLFWMYTPPLISLLGFAELFRRRKTPAARYALAVIFSNIVLYTFYFYQAARFMAPVGALLIVFSSVGAVTLILSPLSRRFRRYRLRSSAE
jgi:4-amino-4-deoxy-L-arabinose transferase-like glycosyltransferase